MSHSETRKVVLPDGATRDLQIFTDREDRVLDEVAERVSPFIHPDTLTASGVFASNRDANHSVNVVYEAPDLNGLTETTTFTMRRDPHASERERRLRIDWVSSGYLDEERRPITDSFLAMSRDGLERYGPFHKMVYPSGGGMSPLLDDMEAKLKSGFFANQPKRIIPR